MHCTKLSFICLILTLIINNGCVRLTQKEKALSSQLSSSDIIPATKEERQAIERKDILIQAAFWAEELEKNPSDTEAALKLTTILRLIGKTENALNVADQALTIHPDNKDLMIAFSLAAIELGKTGNALKTLERLLNYDSINKQGLVLSAICYDQINDYKKSQFYYQKALQHYPEDPLVLTNLGYSHILSGDPEQAEKYLRKAIQKNTLSGHEVRPETRQNLSLALGLQGKYQEAKYWAKQDLPEPDVDKNLAYIKTMIQQPHNWEKLKAHAHTGQSYSEQQSAPENSSFSKTQKQKSTSVKKKTSPILPFKRSF